MERIRIALMEKRVMLGDIFARVWSGGIGRRCKKLGGRCSVEIEIPGSRDVRCEVEALF